MAGELKQYEYYQFVEWIATPDPLREIGSQKELAQHLKVNEVTLSKWKQDPNFWEDVRRQIREWAKEKTPNVIIGLYRRAVKSGDPMAAKLWLQVFEDFKEKNEVEHTGEVRQVIEIHEEKKTLILNAFANFGLIKKADDSSQPTIGPTDSERDNNQPVTPGGNG